MIPRLCPANNRLREIEFKGNSNPSKVSSHFNFRKNQTPFLVDKCERFQSTEHRFLIAFSNMFRCLTLMKLYLQFYMIRPSCHKPRPLLSDNS